MTGLKILISNVTCSAYLLLFIKYFFRDILEFVLCYYGFQNNNLLLYKIF